MAVHFLLRRGLRVDLPATAPEGEPHYCTDTHQLFIGTGTGMVEIAADAATLAGYGINPQAPENGQILIYDQATSKYVPGDPIVSGPDDPGTVPSRPPVQIGAVGDDGDVHRIVTDNSGVLKIRITPATAGGVLPVTGSVGATPTDIKTAPGQLYGWYLINPNLDTVYIQLFNDIAANVLLGTTVPYLVLPVPGTSGANALGDTGIAFGTAISFAITTTRDGSLDPSVAVDYSFFYL